ncbi:MAG: hypothetical protein ACXWQO_05015 [Bdellovibrionota bacterium]
MKIRFHKLALVFLLLHFCAAWNAFAWDPEFGTEPTVQGESTPRGTYEGWWVKLAKMEGTQKLITKESTEARRKLLEIIEERCKIEKCTLSIAKDSHFPWVLKYFGYNTVRVTYPDGFWIQVGFDSGVLEFQTKKSPLSVYESHRDTIQRDIFDSAKAVGLVPSPEGGGAGHVSYDFDTSFEGDRRFARNMLVDEANNAFLGEGLLGPASMNRQNAPSIAIQSEEQQQAFREVLAEFDSNPNMTVDELYEAVRKRVYYKTLNPWKNPVVEMKHEKNQAIALWGKRIEDRRYGPASDADALIAQLRLKRARLAYIRGKEELIPYAPLREHPDGVPALWVKYLEEMGERPKKLEKAVFGSMRAECKKYYASLKAKPKQ